MADFGNKTKQVERKRGEVTAVKIAKMGHFVTSPQTNNITALVRYLELPVQTQISVGVIW